MRNETINWNEEVNGRITERSMKPEGKRAGNFQTLWYDKLTEAAKEDDPDIYQKELKKYYQALEAKRKAPPWKIDEIKVKPL